MEISNVTLFDGVTSSKYPVRIVFEKTGYVIYGYSDDILKVNCADTTIDYSDHRFFKGSFLLREKRAQFQVRLDDKGRKELEDLGYLSRKFWRSVSTLKIAGILTAFLLFLSIGLYFTIPMASNWLASFISFETEVTYFEQAGHSTFSSAICQLSKDQEDILEKVMDRIRPQSGINPKVYMAKLPVENAFAMLGGNIYVDKSLMNKMLEPEEFAAVLAHEYQHLSQRHVLQQLIQTSAFAIAFAIILGDISSFYGFDAATIANMVNLKFSQEMESEADSGALEMLYQASISPGSLGLFFEHLESMAPEEEGKISSRYLNYLSTHPATSERIEISRSYPVPEKIHPLLTQNEWNLLKHGPCIQISDEDVLVQSGAD